MSGVGPHVHVAGRAVDDDGVARIGEAGGVGDLADRRDAERARHDRDVRGRAAFLQHQAAQPLAVVVEQRRRAHGAGDQDGVLRQLFARRRVVLADQLAHQAVGEVVEVVQALAQIGVGRAQHARAGVGLHALDRGLGGEAGHHRLVQPVRPAAVVGEHAVGFEHVAVLAAVGDVAAFEQHVEVGAQGLDRGFEALQFLRHVVGDEIGDDDARLVQHHMAERDAVVERRAGEVQRAARGGARRRAARARRARRRRSSRRAPSRWSAAPRLPPRNRCAARGSAPPARRAYCRRAAPARRGRSGRFLRRFPAGRRRPGASCASDRLIGLASLATRPTRPSSARSTVWWTASRLRPFGGVELERAVDAQHVDGADLRHHVGGDQHHDLVEAFLRADRLRHHLAKPAQQHARTAERATHGVIPRATMPARSAPVELQRDSSRRIRPGPARNDHPTSRISNAACKPQARDNGMTVADIVRRSVTPLCPSPPGLRSVASGAR